MANSSKRGRPISHPLNSRQVKAITARLTKGLQSRAEIAAELGVHPYAVLRVKRAMTAGS